MPVNFDALPTDKPSQSGAVKGKFLAVISKVNIAPSKSSGVVQLTVDFTLQDDSLQDNVVIKEYYQESDKSFVKYKLQRLLTATKVKLQGVGTLNDIAKVVIGKQVLVDVGLNDKGYGIVDYSDNNEGLYPVEDVPTSLIAEAIGDSDIPF